MRIDFTKVLIDPKGNEIKISIEGGNYEEKLTLGKVAYDALLSRFEDKSLPSKFELFKIAKQTLSSKPVDMKVEDITLIKKMIEKSWSTLVVGCAYELIETTNVDKIAEEVK